VPDLDWYSGEWGFALRVDQTKPDAQRQSDPILADVAPLGMPGAVVGALGLLRPQPARHGLGAQQFSDGSVGRRHLSQSVIRRDVQY
jgi:hypothetical protein